MAKKKKKTQQNNEPLVPETLTVKEVSLDETIDALYAYGYHSKIQLQAGGDSAYFHDTFLPPVYHKIRGVPNRRVLREARNEHYYYRHGVDNAFPRFLLDLQFASLYHRMAIQTISSVAPGQGPLCVSEAGVAEDVNTEFKKWLKSKGFNQTFWQLLANSFAVFGHAYVSLFFSPREEDESRAPMVLRRAKVKNPTMYRVGLPDPKTFDTEYLWHSQDFYEKYGQKRTRRGSTNDNTGLSAIKRYKSFLESYDDVQENLAAKTVFQPDLETVFFEDNPKHNLNKYIMYLKEDNFFSGVYGTPSYLSDSMINAIYVHALLSEFDVAALSNGLSTSHIITIPLQRPNAGDKDGKERYDKAKLLYEGKVREELLGAKNADNVMVLFQDPRSENQEVTIAEIPNVNREDVLAGKAKRAETNILAGWGVSNPALVGVPARISEGVADVAENLIASEGIWLSSFVQPYVTQRLVDFVNDELLPIYEAETGTVAEFEVQFPAKLRFKPTPSDEIMLSVFRTRDIYKHLGMEWRDEWKEELLEDLEMRGNFGGVSPSGNTDVTRNSNSNSSGNETE